MADAVNRIVLLPSSETFVCCECGKEKEPG